MDLAENRFGKTWKHFLEVLKVRADALYFLLYSPLLFLCYTTDY